MQKSGRRLSVISKYSIENNPFYIVYQLEFDANLPHTPKPVSCEVFSGVFDKMNKIAEKTKMALNE